MNEKISAWLDGELDNDMADWVLDQVEKQDPMHETCQLYQLIGDSMRGEGATKSDFMSRFDAKLALEPTPIASKRVSKSIGQKVKSHWYSAAASVAALGMVGLMAYQTGRNQPSELIVQGPATVAQQQGMNDYLVVHQQMSGNFSGHDGVMLATMPLDNSTNKAPKK